ncbi:hypothetical protein ACHAXM_011515 [Skeletonema potamos]|jgi:ribonuclease HI
MPKSKWYAVAKGRVPGIYQTWDECKAQTAGFSGAIFKSFKARGDAQVFMISNGASPPPAAADASSCSSVGKKRARGVNDGASYISQNKRSNQHPFKKINTHFCITVHFDGGSRGNPGVAGAGAEVIAVNNTKNPPITTKYLIREFCGDRKTNNYAEYHGLIVGLKKARALLCELVEANASSSAGSSVAIPLLKLNVYGDSNLIIQQLKGNWKCNDVLKPLHQQCQRLIVDIKNNVASSEISFDHVYREQNKVADQLANEAMDQRRSWITTDADVVQSATLGVVRVVF